MDLQIAVKVCGFENLTAIIERDLEVMPDYIGLIDPSFSVRSRL